MSETLSLRITHELADILESRDWDQLDEFIAQHGFDENTEELPS